MSLEALYPPHLTDLDTHLSDALSRASSAGASFDAVVFHAGREATYHADDEAIPFRQTPHFKRWAPVAGPDHVVYARPGARPKVVVVRPSDFWLDTSPPEPDFWRESVDVVEVGAFEKVSRELGPLDRTAFVGGCREAAAELGIEPAHIEPDALMAPLDWHRAVKTAYEIEAIARACGAAANGHLAARKAFEAGATEREVHWEYLRAAGHLEAELPYGSIVAFDEKGAILHYQHKRGADYGRGQVMLIDAGAVHLGYASDITRTWTREGVDPVFVALVEGVDVLERELVGLVTSGRSYVDVHVATHRGVAKLLSESGIFKGSAEEAFESGATRPFLPHGVGHHLGLQVHDVGGRQKGPEGGTVPPPEAYPALRTTRTIEPGHVVTIEPGFYFVPMLLEPWRTGDGRDRIDWGLVDRLTPHGGVRIEDDVVCTEAEPRDLTRDRVPGPRGM